MVEYRLGELKRANKANQSVTSQVVTVIIHCKVDCRIPVEIHGSCILKDIGGGSRTDFKDMGGGSCTDFKDIGGGSCTDFKDSGGGSCTDFKDNGGGSCTDFKDIGGGSCTDFKDNGGGSRIDFKGIGDISVIMDNKGDISSKDLMDFLKGFKSTMEDRMETSEKKNEDTTARIEARLGIIDLNFDQMKVVIKDIAEKNEKDIDKISNRLLKLEEDVKRVKFARMKSPDKTGNSGMTVLPVNYDDPAYKQSQKERVVTSSPVQVVQPVGRSMGADQWQGEKSMAALQNQERRNQPMQRQTSWADEMEYELANAASRCVDGKSRKSSQVDWFDGIPL